MDKPKIHIRKATAEDQNTIWDILAPTIAAGDTLAFATDSPKADMIDFWCGPDKYTYVAELGGEVVGTFFMKANQPGQGAHVVNAGYVTNPQHRGKGLARAMCAFSLTEAKELGFTHMQYNIVVKSNERAIKLWQDMGFEIVGEIPEVFNHRQLGLTNAYVMWRRL